MADMGQKRSFLKLSAMATSDNKSIFFGFKMGQTKHKPLRTRNFLRFSERNCGLHLEHFFLKIITRNRTLLSSSNIQIPKFLKVINKMRLVSKNLFRLLQTRCCNWCLKNQVLQKEDEKWFKLSKNEAL